MEQPVLSVIVATCNHAAVLPMCLQHLENQEYPSGRFEIIVADAGSNDNTLELAQRYASGSPVRVVPLSADRARGLVGALNAGAQAAQGRLLLLLAPALLAGPTLVARHVATHTGSGGPRAVLGRVQVHPQVELPSFTPWFYEFAFGPESEQPPEFMDWQAFNLSLPRREFTAVGGFDETFAFPVFHACELGWRLTRSGIKAVREPEAHTYRWQAISLDEALFLRYVQGYNLHRLAQLTHDIGVLNRYPLDTHPLRVMLDRTMTPFYLRVCRGSVGEAHMFGAVLRRTLRHYFLQGYRDAHANRAATPPVTAATYPAA